MPRVSRTPSCTPPRFPARRRLRRCATWRRRSGLKFLRPDAGHGARRHRHQSQGDRSLRANLARRESGATGRGIRIGVLSDSYDCAPGAFEPGAPFTRAAQDIANGDLPRDVLVLKDLSDCAERRLLGRRARDDAAHPRRRARHRRRRSTRRSRARKISPRAFARWRTRVRRSSSTTSSTSPSRCSKTASSRRRSMTCHRDGVAYFSSAGNDARAVV